MKRSTQLPVALVAAAMCWLAGCSSMQTASSAGAIPSVSYETVRIVYEIDAGRLGVPMAVARVGAQQVSYEQVPSSPVAGRSVGQLEIQYPHPSGRRGVALVGVVIQQEADPGPGLIADVSRLWKRITSLDDSLIGPAEKGQHEAWVLEIPKSELDGLLARLHSEGIFNGESPSDESVRITSSVDGRMFRKKWRQIPELDAMMVRIRGAGQLVSYQGVAAPRNPASGTPPSLVAYQQLNQQPVPTAGTWGLPAGTAPGGYPPAGYQQQLAQQTAGPQRHTAIYRPPLAGEPGGAIPPPAAAYQPQVSQQPNATGGTYR